MATPTSGQIVDEFENSFQACLAALTNPDHFNVRDTEEIKTGVEQTIQRFLDLAKQMECFFLQKRLLLSVQKPEHIILEDISELKNELIRKDQLLQKYYEKIQVWQNLLSEVSGTPRALNQPTGQQQPNPQGATAHQQPPPPSMVGISNQMSMPISQPMLQGQQHHLMPPHCGTSMPNAPVPGSIPAGLAPQQQVMVSAQAQPPQMHSSSHLAPNQTQGGLQGPLAYLERTMSNIGMPDAGR